MRVLAPRIRQTNLELVSLYEAGRIIGEHAEVGMMLSGLLAVLTEATSCTRGAAFLINPGTGMLECRAAFGYEGDPSGWTEARVGGIAEEILRTEGAVVVENFPIRERFQSLQPVGYETSSMLGAALRVRGEPIGMIILCDKVDRQGQPAHFTSGDANVLSGIAAQASGAVDSARLHEEAREKEKLDRVYFRF
jgi:GAF domain-containing protein